MLRLHGVVGHERDAALHGKLHDLEQAGAVEQVFIGRDGLYCAVPALPGGAGVSLRIAAAGGQPWRRAIEQGWIAVREALFGEPPASRRQDYGTAAAGTAAPSDARARRGHSRSAPS